MSILTGGESQEWHFRAVVAPTEFDIVSPIVVLLWLYRNASSKVVLFSFGRGILLYLVLVCACGMIVLYWSLSHCGRTTRVGSPG